MEQSGHVMGDLPHMKGIGGVKPEVQPQTYQFFQEYGHVRIGLKKKGVVVKGEVLNAMTAVPEEDLLKHVIGAPLMDLRI